jgi:hypothetical protein
VGGRVDFGLRHGSVGCDAESRSGFRTRHGTLGGCWHPRDIQLDLV